ncbi:MAG: hypothetical protein OJF51_001848 [Nitrospira sp.]|jgi:hypothetical protein|nr:MAG: hypothetical protein OJF51_001848 [Nitrospira sp.]
MICNRPLGERAGACGGYVTHHLIRNAASAAIHTAPREATWGDPAVLQRSAEPQGASRRISCVSFIPQCKKQT